MWWHTGHSRYSATTGCTAAHSYPHASQSIFVACHFMMSNHALERMTPSRDRCNSNVPGGVIAQLGL